MVSVLLQENWARPVEPEVTAEEVGVEVEEVGVMVVVGRSVWVLCGLLVLATVG